MEWGKRHINRLKLPIKKVVVCEDDLLHQAEMTKVFSVGFERQGDIEFTFTSSGAVAHGVIQLFHKILHMPTVLILDHDMPHGNGTDLINAIHETNFDIPIITASGIPENNLHMERLCKERNITCYRFEKNDVIGGKCNELIVTLLSMQEKGKFHD